MLLNWLSWRAAEEALSPLLTLPCLPYYLLVLAHFFILSLQAFRHKKWHRRPRDDCSVNSSPSQLTQEHVESIASRRWKTVLAWIVFNPDELVLLDKKKQTALHHACLFRAPAQVIEMILFQAPELAGVANVDGELALHWAVRLSAPNEIIKLLLAANPTSGLLARDKDGNTPLSLLWERGQEGFLEAWWEDREKLFNLHSWKRIMYLLRSRQFASQSSATASQDGEIVLRPEFEDAAFRPAHVAAGAPCPPGFFPLILRAYADQLDKLDDNSGRSPLAIACTDVLANRSWDVSSKIHMLLAECPVMAHVPDHQGRLPLFLALESGIAWDEGVQQLFSLDPKVLGVRDVLTGLYPFMLAAVGAGQRTHSAKEESSHPCHDRSLTTIYNLLRAEPVQVGPVE